MSLNDRLTDQFDSWLRNEIPRLRPMEHSRVVQMVESVVAHASQSAATQARAETLAQCQHLVAEANASLVEALRARGGERGGA